MHQNPSTSSNSLIADKRFAIYANCLLSLLSKLYKFQRCVQNHENALYTTYRYSQVDLKISFLVLYKKYLQTNDLEKKSYGERSLFVDDYAYLDSNLHVVTCSNTEVNASKSYHHVVLAVCKCSWLMCKETYKYIKIM